jgi:hypothetical protein
LRSRSANTYPAVLGIYGKSPPGTIAPKNAYPVIGLHSNKCALEITKRVVEPKACRKAGQGAKKHSSAHF